MTDPRADAHGQQAYTVRLEQGPTGAHAVVRGADTAVVVDVLSFTTTLSVAVERGLLVYPFPWRDDRAADFAAERDAFLAVGRLEQQESGQGVSLSPARMLTGEGLPPSAERLVLPSPNGSTICAALAVQGVNVVGACLRDRSAVAETLAPALREGGVLAVVAAGERWSDGSLRPAAEDIWGAGALLGGLVERGATGLSPEAELAVTAYQAVADDLPVRLRDCAGGRELAAAGFADDVEVAAALDTTTVVSVLRDNAFGDLGEGGLSPTC